jgi:hypothetical protein
MSPQLLAAALAERQRPGDAHQVETEGDQHQRWRAGKGRCAPALPGQRHAGLTERTGDGAGHGVADDASRVVRQVQAEACRGTHRQGADDAAAHADAVRATQQTDQQQGEISWIQASV